MRDPKALVEDSFDATEVGRSGLAVVSLGLALRAYVSTARALGRAAFEIVETCVDAQQQQERDFSLGRRYQDASFETIIHLQHFAELVVGEALRSRHKLLAEHTTDKHVLLDKLLRGEPIEHDEDNRLHSIDASNALERASVLLKEKRLPPEYAFIETHRGFLSQLTKLRNRMWHRGVAVLRYDALDELVCGHAIPFIDAATQLPPYATLRHVWALRQLHCEIDVFAELRATIERSPSTRRRMKVAFLKELARAAYASPVTPPPSVPLRKTGVAKLFGKVIERPRRDAEAIATARSRNEPVHEILSCFVCGSKSFLVESTMDDFIRDDGKHVGHERTWAASCTCCSFAIDDRFGNPSDHGWTKLPQLFKTLWSGAVASLDELEDG